MGDERIRDGDVLIACNDQVAGIMTYGTPYAITPEVGEFVSAQGMDWDTSLNGVYAHLHAYAQAALSRPAGTLAAATPNLARGACVWCFACHRDPVTVHPYDRRLIITEMGVDTSHVSCAEVNTWLYIRRTGAQEPGIDRRGCSGSFRRPAMSMMRNSAPELPCGSPAVGRTDTPSGETAPVPTATNLVNADDTYHLFTDALRHPLQKLAVTSTWITQVDGDPNGEVTSWSAALSSADSNGLARSFVINHDIILATLRQISTGQLPVRIATADLVRAVLTMSGRELLDDQLCLITAEAAYEIISAAAPQLDSGGSTTA